MLLVDLTWGTVWANAQWSPNDKVNTRLSCRKIGAAMADDNERSSLSRTLDLTGESPGPDAELTILLEGVEIRRRKSLTVQVLPLIVSAFAALLATFFSVFVNANFDISFIRAFWVLIPVILLAVSAALAYFVRYAKVAGKPQRMTYGEISDPGLAGLVRKISLGQLDFVAVLAPKRSEGEGVGEVK